jgi:hypothetical protein
METCFRSPSRRAVEGYFGRAISLESDTYADQRFGHQPDALRRREVTGGAFGYRIWPIACVGHPLQAAEPSGKTEIIIQGAPDHGVFDPSVARSESGALYMTLSGVSSTKAGGGLGDLAVRTMLARSDDQGKSWPLVNDAVNRDIEVRLDSFAAPHRGRWQSEVSALLFDPFAQKESRWKLFWHQYLNANGKRRFEHGWLAYKEADRPEALASARPIKLFTALGYDTTDNQASSPTQPPIAGDAVTQIQRLHKDLSRCVAVSEPGVLAKPDGVYLVLTCFEGSFLGLLGVNNRVILLKCAQPCHAGRPDAWSYVGTLLNDTDARRLSMGKFSGSELTSFGGSDYLIALPVGTVPGEGSYKGCAVFQFDLLGHARIARDKSGVPQVHSFVQFSTETFNGACTAVPDGPQAGLVMGEVEFARGPNGDQPKFHIYMTNHRP